VKVEWMAEATQDKMQIGGLAGWAIATVQRGRQNVAARRREKQLMLLETLPLGGKRQLALVVCDGRRFLVGMGAESVDAIVAVEVEGAATSFAAAAAGMRPSSGASWGAGF
jgi:flagellar biogenesis protein FliO